MLVLREGIEGKLERSYDASLQTKIRRFTSSSPATVRTFDRGAWTLGWAPGSDAAAARSRLASSCRPSTSTKRPRPRPLKPAGRWWPVQRSVRSPRRKCPPRVEWSALQYEWKMTKLGTRPFIFSEHIPDFNKRSGKEVDLNVLSLL